ncbi:MAG: hypothetical protein UW14_C0004G0001 [Candidatus Yanofskybacteria bacterium GW2011_GWA2_44_10]|nr:MAG: hypothetical protein UW14_C0004G0001 [Candidatus Yanofskybacteria bacterium GW2011_GWA2_44_10]
MAIAKKTQTQELQVMGQMMAFWKLRETTRSLYLLNLQGVSGSITQNVAITLVVVSLNVDLDVSINSASGVWDDFITGANPLNDVDFRVTVGGTAAGTINYKLDCTNDGVWEREVNNTFVNPYEFLDACSYSTALPSQTFTARVMVQRDVANWDYDTVQITVTNQADFNISASKSIIYSPRTGVSESAGVSINPINGFNSSVTLSISSTGNNLPAGSNANFSINPISQGSISSLSFSVVAGTPVGIYSFNLKGISGSLTHEIPMTLEVVDLNVDLMAAINGGATGIWFAALIGDIPFNDIDFRATVSGTAQGTINFKLDCDGDGILEAGEPNLTGVSLDANNQYTIIDACDYASAGVFNPRVTIERSAAIPATDTVQITAQDPALPTLSCNLSANPKEMA